jgi:hypothetical protein
MEAQRAPAARSARATNCSTQRGDGGDRGRWNNDPVAAQETLLDAMLRSALANSFAALRRLTCGPPSSRPFQHEDSSALAFPAGQGLDLLETRGWADRASGVIEV